MVVLNEQLLMCGILRVMHVQEIDAKVDISVGQGDVRIDSKGVTPFAGGIVSVCRGLCVIDTELQRYDKVVFPLLSKDEHLLIWKRCKSDSAPVH